MGRATGREEPAACTTYEFLSKVPDNALELHNRMVCMDDLGGAELGQRLRLARERAGLTQAQAAEQIEITRTALAAIEGGQRPVRMEELRRLAHSYGESVNVLTRPEAAQVDVLKRFRPAAGNERFALRQATEGLSNLAKAEAELGSVLGIQPGTLRPNLLAAEAYRRGLMSEGQLARLLDVGRVELREILDGVDAERDVDGVPPLSR